MKITKNRKVDYKSRLYMRLYGGGNRKPVLEGRIKGVPFETLARQEEAAIKGGRHEDN